MKTHLIHHKMQLLPLILGIVLLPKACALVCHGCEAEGTETCKDEEVMCSPSTDQCYAMRMTSYSGTAVIIDTKIKGCVQEEMCGNHSFNDGLSKYLISMKCCPTDLCNKNHTSEPIGYSPNGKKCYYCLGKQCKGILNCEGNEDYCITIKEKNMKMMGCASKNFCYGAIGEKLQELLEAKISCCQGDFCNSGSSTRAGLLLPVALYISLLTFS